MILGILLFEFGKSLLFNGRIWIVYTILMVLGAIMFVADDWYHVGWYIDFQNEITNNTFGIVALGVCGTFVIKIWRMILTREEE